MINAIYDRIFIRIEDKNNKSKGGVLLPENYRNPPNIGYVESIGSKVSSVKIGDKVLFHQFDELPSYDDKIVVVRENSILGVFTK